MEIYLLSKKNDPTFIIGQQQHLINLEKLNLVKSKLLPNINFTANQTHVNNKDKLNTFNNGNKNSINYETSNYSLNIDQPIFNLAVMSMYYTGKKEILASLKKYEDLEQELLSKVIEQYFAILSAINQVEITKAAIETFSQQLDKATQKCNVGLATINDVNAAKAKLDNANAQKITDVNSLNTEKEKLSQFVGKFIHTV
ncbi:MAG: TolC family protein, partial [Gammaproteobacteria bacterium]